MINDLKEKLKELLKNKQFWLAVIAVIVIFIKSLWPALPLTDEEISKAFWVLIAFIVGLPVADLVSMMKIQLRLPPKR